MSLINHEGDILPDCNMSDNYFVHIHVCVDVCLCCRIMECPWSFVLHNHVYVCIPLLFSQVFGSTLALIAPFRLSSFLAGISGLLENK